MCESVWWKEKAERETQSYGSGGRTYCGSLRRHTRIGGIDFIRKPFFVLISLRFTSKTNNETKFGLTVSLNIIVLVSPLQFADCSIYKNVLMFLFCVYCGKWGSLRSIIISWFRLEFDSVCCCFEWNILARTFIQKNAMIRIPRLFSAMN